MAVEFLKKYWKKYFNPSLPLNPPVRERDWVCLLVMILSKRTWWVTIQVESEEGEGTTFIIALPG